MLKLQDEADGDMLDETELVLKLQDEAGGDMLDETEYRLLLGFSLLKENL